MLLLGVLSGPLPMGPRAEKRAPGPWEPSVQPPLVGTAVREALVHHYRSGAERESATFEAGRSPHVPAATEVHLARSRDAARRSAHRRDAGHRPLARRESGLSARRQEVRAPRSHPGHPRAQRSHGRRSRAGPRARRARDLELRPLHLPRGARRSAHLGHEPRRHAGGLRSQHQHGARRPLERLLSRRPAGLRWTGRRFRGAGRRLVLLLRRRHRPLFGHGSHRRALPPAARLPADRRPLHHGPPSGGARLPLSRVPGRWCRSTGAPSRCCAAAPPISSASCAPPAWRPKSCNSCRASSGSGARRRSPWRPSDEPGKRLADCLRGLEGDAGPLQSP